MNYYIFSKELNSKNRGAAHVYTCLWGISIDSMIDEHIIRPDKQNEPEIYEKVVKHQIYTSLQRCGGPASSGQQCKRGFQDVTLQ